MSDFNGPTRIQDAVVSTEQCSAVRGGSGADLIQMHDLDGEHLLAAEEANAPGHARSRFLGRQKNVFDKLSGMRVN